MPRPALRPYQSEAVEFLHRTPRAALLLDMGLGKTASVLTALEPRHLPALVVANKRVAEWVWPAECALWRPDLKVAVAAGSPKKRSAALADTTADIVVIGRDNLADAVGPHKRFKTFVIDELSSFRTPRAARTKAAAKISLNGPKYVWGMTGTPRPKGLMDLYAQYYIIDGGVRLGTGITNYRRDFFTEGRRLPSGVVTQWIPLPGAEEKIYGAVEDISLVMQTEGRVDLPEMLYNRIEIPVSPKVWALYAAMKRDYVIEVEGHTIAAANAAIRSQKLEQLANGFLYTDDSRGENRPFINLSKDKITALDEVIEGTGSPVLVAYRTHAHLAMLREAYGDLLATPKTPRFIERWNAGELPILAAHPDAIGHGLNLQHGGHTIVWMDLPWDLEQWQQFNKRLNRSGQKNTVTVHYMVAPRTVDEVKFDVVSGREDEQTAMMRHLESPI